jgi:predicted outer membrane repeat protein
MSASGYYQLRSDISGRAVLNVNNAHYTLDLNGYVWQGNSVFTVITMNGTGSVLNLVDSRPEAENRGTLESSLAYENLWSYDQSGSTVLYGGVITGGGGTSSGGIQLNKTSTLNMYGGNIAGNRQTGSSGAGAGVRMSSSSASFTMSGGRICYNYAARNGGGAFLMGNVTMTGGTIDHNTAKYNGGGLRLSSQENMTLFMQNVVLENNTAIEQNGGGINISMGESGVINGSATKPITIEIIDCVISGNTSSKGHGGGLSITEEPQVDVSVTIDRNTVIKDNTSALSGGGIYLESGTLTVNDGQIENNTSSTNGGAFAISKRDKKSGTFIMNGGVMSANSAAENGGAGYITQGSAAINGGLIIANAAVQGGGIWLSQGSISVTGGEITKNTAANGGGIYVDSGHFTLSKTGTVSENTAEKNGGGLYVSNGDVLIEGGSLSTNHALTGDGGGLFLSNFTSDEAKIQITSGVISNNSAAQNGGAVAVEGGSAQGALEVVIGVNEDHFDEHGNSLDCDHAQNDPDASCPVIENNTAANTGGAVFLSGSENASLNIYCLQEQNNTASAGQGNSDFLMMEGGKAIITTGTDTSNENGTAGDISISGSIHIIGGSLDLYGIMANPYLQGVITVDLEKETDHFQDHRILPEGSEAVYWIHYYENFAITNEDGSTYMTGRFKAVPIIKDASGNYLHTIQGAVYSRPGYTIQGWNTASNGTGNTYSVGDIYAFPNVQFTDGNSDMTANENTGMPSTLVLYAIWNVSLYTVIFDANIATSFGSMEEQIIAMNTYQKLNANQFSSQGKIFAGWNTKADGSGDFYADQAPVYNLASKNGQTITLYAQWQDCDHSHGSYRYEARGNTIVQICDDCQSELGKVTLTALDADYDGSEHTADLSVQGNWQGNLPVLSYKMAASKWDNLDGALQEWQDNPVPVHAGNYTAVLSIENVTVSVEYQIAQIAWPAASKVELQAGANGNSANIITVISPDEAGYEYLMRYEKDGEMISTGWQSSPDFAITTYNIFHYFSVRKMEDRDHTVSPVTTSPAYLSHNGITVVLETETGIEIENGQAGTGSLVFGINTEEGYHFTNLAVSSKVQNSDLQAPEVVLEEKEDGTYSAAVKNLEDGKYTGKTIVISIAGAAKNASIKAKAANGEIFTNFNGQTVSISSDSSFTARFVISDFFAAEYEEGTFTFSDALPAGTSLTLLADNTYWYLNLKSAKESISLGDFIKMGTVNEKYQLEESDQADTKVFQLSVNFENAQKEIQTESLQLNLEFAAKGNTKAPDLQLEEQVEAKISEKAEFDLSISNNTLALLYNSAEGFSSFLANRSSALVITSRQNLPADLQLVVQENGKTGIYTQNTAGEFIVPLSDFSDMQSPFEMLLDVKTAQKIEKDIVFDIEWKISSTKAAEFSSNGTLKAKTSWTYSSTAGTPSLKVTMDERIYTLSQMSSLDYSVLVQWMDLPEDAVIKAELYKMTDDGSYVSTAYKAAWLAAEDGKAEHTHTLGGQSAGYFCLLYTIDLGGKTLVQVPVYFIVR